MALPRSIEDSDKQMRTAAIERLRTEFGVKLSKHNRCSTRIVDAIRQLEPHLQSENPMLLIRAWVGLKPSDVVPGRLAAPSDRPYVMDAGMRIAAERASFQPHMISMSSSVLYASESL
ncbi:hypothetical protein A7J71_18005 [Achromobacter insolitus]|nr:hypothetical protein A7J71_18005 [Achromobacter insolitus]OCZ50652.1 hypothetical protein A7P22_15335 [Achromobacter insolitus]